MENEDIKEIEARKVEKVEKDSGSSLNSGITPEAELDVLLEGVREDPRGNLALQERMAQIDEDFYPRDEQGNFIGRNPKSWKKGQSGNPKGRPRPMTHMYGKFCQIAQMSELELNMLLKRNDLTLADKAAISLALNVSQGAWPQQLEMLNREEGKVQDNVKIEVPPTPIRFVPASGHKLIEEMEQELGIQKPGELDESVELDEPGRASDNEKQTDVSNANDVGSTHAAHEVNLVHPANLVRPNATFDELESIRVRAADAASGEATVNEVND